MKYDPKIYKITSNKWRRVAKLPKNKNGFQALKAVDPEHAKAIYEKINDIAADIYLRTYAEPIYLTKEEWAEFKKSK